MLEITTNSVSTLMAHSLHRCVKMLSSSLFLRFPHRLLLCIALLLVFASSQASAMPTRSTKKTKTGKAYAKTLPKSRKKPSNRNKEAAWIARAKRDPLNVKIAIRDFPQLAKIESVLGLPDVPRGKLPEKSIAKESSKTTRDGLTRINREVTRTDGELWRTTATSPLTKPGTKGYQPPRYRTTVILDGKTPAGESNISLIGRYDAGGFTTPAGTQQSWIGFIMGKRSGTLSKLVTTLLPEKPRAGDNIELQSIRKSGGQLALEVALNGRVFTYDVVRQSNSILFRMSSPPPSGPQPWTSPTPVTN